MSDDRSKGSVSSFNRNIDPITADDATLEEYTLYKITRYKQENIEDHRLWDLMQMGFEGFKEEHFRRLSNETMNLLLDYCRTHGYWINNNYGKHGSRYSFIVDTLTQDYHKDWTEEQIEWVERHHDGVPLSTNMMRRKEKLARGSPTTAAATPVIPMRQLTSNLAVPWEDGQQIQSTTPLVTQDARLLTAHTIQGGNTGRTNAYYDFETPSKSPKGPPDLPESSLYPRLQPYEPNLQHQYETRPQQQYEYKPPPQPHEPRVLSQENRPRPPRQQYESRPSQHPQQRQYHWPQPDQDNDKDKNYSKELTMLDKIYKNEDKFGDTGDNFSFKLNIFYDKCKKVGLSPKAYLQGASTMLTGQALSRYYSVNPYDSFSLFVQQTKQFFEGPEWQRNNLTKWNEIKLSDFVISNPTLSLSDCLRKMCTELETLHRGIGQEFQGPTHMRENIIRACRGHPALTNGLTDPPADVPGLVNKLYTSVTNYEAIQKASGQTYVQEETSQSNFVERNYRGNGRQQMNRFNKQGDNGSRYGSTEDHRYGNNKSYGQKYRGNNRDRGPESKKLLCFVCHKMGCWSTNHPKHELDRAKQGFVTKYPSYKNDSNRLHQYIVHCEGEGDDDENHYEYEDAEHFYAEEESEGLTIETVKEWREQPTDDTSSYFTTFGELQDSEPKDTVQILADKSLRHRMTSIDDTVPVSEDIQYSLNSTSTRYDSSEFKGILIDSGAAIHSTGGTGQLQALQQIDKTIELDRSKVGAVNIVFGIGNTSSIGVIHLDTPLGMITFHIVDVNTPFLLCLRDMDRLGAIFNNIRNEVIQSDRSMTHPVLRRYGHAFLLWHTSAYAVVTESFANTSCVLTETELRRLHRRFGHPSVQRLRQVLERSGHRVEMEALEHLTKFCEHCQKYGKSPGRFSFTMKDDVEFNYNIIVDILYIENKPVLHIVDDATRFQTGRWLREISARHVWDQLRSCWIDTYLGPPDMISTDAGTQFVAKEFKQYASNMGITVKNVPVEAHHSIGAAERYHGPLRRAYTIIVSEIPGIKEELALQMAFKALNDSVGPDGLVPTLLVFGAYPRMTEMDAPSQTITQRSIAMRKAMEEIRKSTARRHVNDALNIRNGPSTTQVHGLPISSLVLVWREGSAGHLGSWKGPYRLIDLQNESVTVELPSGPTKFRSTSVKPYNTPDSDDEDVNSCSSHAGQDVSGNDIDPPASAVLEKDSQVPLDNELTISTRRRRGRPRRYPVAQANLCFLIDDDATEDLKLPQFAVSRQKEVTGLLEKNVFEIVNDQNSIPAATRIFNSRFVDEVKNLGTEKAFEKSRLVVQAYNDADKGLVLTQSPTIQRVSQRLILCLAATLDDAELYLRDVTQAYVQSKSNLSRDFYIRPPKELIEMIGANKDCILKVVKPLYGVPEAGNHWFATYHGHHTRELNMEQSTYDPCLLYRAKPFGLIGMQTDDTLVLAEDQFAEKEEKGIHKAGIMTKVREQLTVDKPIKFNGGVIQLQKRGFITMTQEKHVAGIALVKDYKASTMSSRGTVRAQLSTKEQYVAQRARGAYIASLCQPEASFDLSYAAQAVNPTPTDVNALNRRLKWQLDNQTKGLRFVKLDQTTLRLVVFTDSSFANNRDLSSQIGYVICLTDASDTANIIHWSSVKCKRVTRSVLAAELYGMAHGFDLGAVIKATIQEMLQIHIPLILCTDSKSLYDCLVKLGTTQEKRLMIDVMSLRQSYERREVAEIKWIHGQNNPADSMTKSKASGALKAVIDTNKINLDTSEWVERAELNTDQKGA